jgi:ElaB/YqjD/DUF883 family membrane-anchored ribosome-binding protein
MSNPISSAADRTDVLIETAKQTAESAIRSTQQAADEQLNQVADTLSEKVENVRNPAPAISRIANDAELLRRRSTDALRSASFQVRESASRAGDSTVAYIRDEPVKSVLIAAAIGAASMVLLKAVSRAGSRE